MEMILRKEVILSKSLCRLIGIGSFVLLTSLGAFVRIPLPFTPVPITLQTFFVLLSGIFLGGNLGMFSQLTYILLGVLGLPIFTNAGSGLLYMCGPTGGYLAGFVIASLLGAKLIKYAKDSLFSIFVVLCIADLTLFGTGLIWLKFLSGYSFSKLLFIGFMPFVLGDLLKIFIASILYLKLKNRLKEIF